MKFRRHVPKLLALALSWLLIGYIAYVYAQTTLSTIYIMGGIYSGAPSYTVWQESSTYYAKDAYGQIDYSGTNASAIFYSVIAAMGGAGKIFVAKGTYVLTNSIVHNSNGHLIIECEASHFDRFYLNDISVEGTIFEADGIDAFLIGSTSSTSACMFTLTNCFISGETMSTEPLGDSPHSAGCGINLTQYVRYCELNRVTIHRKEYGVFIQSSAGKEIVRVHLNDVIFSRNHWGLYHTSYTLRYLVLNNVEGYLNHRSFIKVSPSYDVVAYRLDDEASSWNVSAGSHDTPIYITVTTDIHLSRVSVYGSKEAVANPAYALMELNFGENATAILDDIILCGGDNRGLYLQGSPVSYFFHIDQFLIGKHLVETYGYRGATDSLDIGIRISNAGRGVLSDGQVYATTPISNASTLTIRYCNVWNSTHWLNSDP